MTAEVYVLASSDTVILLARDVGNGTFRVTAWTAGGSAERIDRAGALLCAQHAAGEWSRVDLRPYTGDGIPLPWAEAWILCENLVPELTEVGLRTRGDYLVIGDAKQRVEAVRARAKRVKQRKRAGGKKKVVDDGERDQGPTGLGGSRWS